MQAFLGRGGNKFIFENDYVIKTTASVREAEFMKAFPGAFIPVHETQPLKMPCWHNAEPNEYEEALIYGLTLLKEHIWVRRAYKKDKWKELLAEHLHASAPSRHKKIIDFTLEHLTSPLCATIHGDATVANILKNNNNSVIDINTRTPRPRVWRWIDPLARPYIPDDPHVDLGKMFQSCWGYERILIDENYQGRFNKPLAQKLTKLSGLNYDCAWHWHTIHLIRLLPYQDDRVRKEFERILDVYFRP